MKVDFKQFTEDLKVFMHEHRLNQRDVSKASGVNSSTMSRMVLGKGKPDVDNLVLLCTLMNIPLSKYVQSDSVIVYSKGANTLQKIKASIDADKKLSKDQKRGLYELMVIAYNFAKVKSK